MPRASFCFSGMLFLTGALFAAQPPKDAPKELTYDGKSLSEWVKLLGSKDAGENRKAHDAIRTLGNDTDAVAASLWKTVEQGKDGFVESVMALVALGPRAMPAVTAGLWSEKDAAREAACSILLEIGADARSATPILARLLADPSATVRRAAAQALRLIWAHDRMPALKKALDDPEISVRQHAARALMSLGVDAKVVIPVLTAMLKDQSHINRQIAIRLLTVLGPEAAPAVPALIEQLPDAQALSILESTAADVAIALGEIGPAAKDAIPALKKKMHDKKTSPLILTHVAIALWQIDRDPEAAKILRQDYLLLDRPTAIPDILWRIDSGKDAQAALTELLKSEKPEIAIAAAGVLGAKAKDAIPLLGKMLANKDPNVRARAVVALNRLGPAAKEVDEPLRGAMKDDSPQIAFWAAVAVCRLDPKPDAVAAVAGYLSDPSPSMRLDAVEVIASLGASGKPAAPRLTVALGDNEEQIRLAAALALWRIEQNPTALASAVERLRSPDSRIRALAASDIGAAFGSDAKSAVPELVKRLFDPFSAVRSSAAEALGRIGPAANDAAPALLTLLDGDEPAFAQSAACEALGLIQPADKDAASAILKKKLEHPDPLTRIHAALALNLIAGDKSGEKEAERGLGYRTYHVRITAAETLWRIKQDARVVPLLVRTLEESNLDGTQVENERYMAVRALGRIGNAAKPAVPELLKLVNHRDVALAATVADALKAIDPETAKKARVK